MAFSGNKHITGRFFEAHNRQQSSAQIIQTRPRFCTDVNAIFRTIHRLIEQIGFIDQCDQRRACGRFIGQLDEQLCIRLIALRHLRHVHGIHQMQDNIGLLHRPPCAFNADFLHHIIGVTQTCGVNDIQRHTFNLNHLRHRISRCPRNGGDNRNILTGQCVKQR